MNNNYSIYAHINKINNKIYVGQTKQKLEYRWGKKGKGYKKQEFYQAVQKYGWDAFEHIILDTNLTQQEANEKEKYYIAFFDSYYNGYNATLGGKNRTLTQQEKDNISEFMKIKQLGGSNSNAHKIICLNTKKQFDTIKEAGEWCSAFPENISQACQRQGACGTHPDTGEALYWCLAEKYTETVQREFELNKNKLIKKRIAKIKQVQQLDLKTNEVLATYKSCAEAAQIVLQDKTKSKGISRCACGDRNHAYGYKWRYIT